MTPKELAVRRAANTALTIFALQCLYDAEQDRERAIVLFAENANADKNVRMLLSARREQLNTWTSRAPKKTCTAVT